MENYQTIQNLCHAKTNYTNTFMFALEYIEIDFMKNSWLNELY